MTQRTFKKHYSMLFVLCLFGLTAAALILNSEKRLEEVVSQHNLLLDNSARGTAREISLKLNELRRAVRLFGEREKYLLGQLVEEEDNVAVYEQIVERVKKVFPYAFAVTFADNKGEPYIEDFDGFISMQCLIDIRTFAQTGNPVAPYLHTNPYGYHIDIMTYLDLGMESPTIFFVSFKPDVIVQLLANNQIFQHQMMLVHQEKPNLVEIIAKGSRKILDENAMFLTDDQQKGIVHSVPVEGALWNLVYLTDDDMNGFRMHTWLETGIEILLLLLFCFLMFRQFSRSEIHIRKAQKAAEDANRSKSAFLANMSHEIRTPMTAIIGFANTLTDKKISPSDRNNAATTIIQNGKHLLSLINNILDLSKVEAGKLDVEHVAVHPFEIISNTEMLVKPQAREKGLSFDIEYEFPLPLEINSDATRLTQILMNLIANALKFTEQGGITLHVSYDRSVNHLCFDVIDTGIGLTRKQSETIFEEFSQADASITRKYGGTGLGLPLTRELVRLLGGTLTLSSDHGVGSKFSFSVSTGSVNGEQMISGENQIPDYVAISDDLKDMPLLSGRILLAEDTSTIRDLFRIYIKNIGAELTMVENGKLAVERARNETFDVILMDMQMPVMGGVEAVRILRKEGNHARIFALTANAMKEDRDRCFAAGYDDFLTKPIQQSELYAKLAGVLPSKVLSSRHKEGESLVPIRSAVLDNEPDMKDIVVRFIQSLPATINEMRQVLVEENWDELKEIIHQLIGTSGGIGYPSVSDLAREIEALIRESNFEHIEGKLLELQGLSNRISAGEKELECSN